MVVGKEGNEGSTEEGKGKVIRKIGRKGRKEVKKVGGKERKQGRKRRK